jgi:hypothetical protein
MLDLIRILMLLGIGILVGAMLMNNREALDALKADVAANHSAVESAITLINGLVNRLTDALARADGEDLVTEIQSIRDDLTESSVELGNSVAQNTASEGDSTNFPPPPPSDTGATPDSGPAPADTGGASTAGSDAGASDPATASAGSDSGSDAAVDDSGAGVDEETAAAADQVPADVGESLPVAGDVFTGDSEGDAQPDTQPGNSNNPDGTTSSSSDDGQPSA